MKRLIIIKGFVFLVLFLLALFFFHEKIFSRGIELRFEYEHNTDLEYQVFYTDNAKDPLTAKLNVVKMYPSGKGEGSLFIPSTRLEILRLDTGRNAPHELIIKNLRLQTSFSDVVNLDPHSFRCSNIDSYRVEEGQLYINSNKQDPYLTYIRRLGVNGKGVLKCNYFYLFISLFVPFYLTCIIFDKLQDRKQVEKASPLIIKRGQTLYNVEFLRVLFTFFVLVTHFFLRFKIWNTGGQAVEFFFLLSGYLLALSYRPERSILDIALSRYIRFVPLVVIGGILAGGEWASFRGCWMLQNTGLLPSRVDVPNAPAWYIAVLFWCTLLYLAILKCCKTRTAMLLTAVLGFLALLLTVQTPGDRHELFAGCIPRGMLRGVSCMAIGILMAQFCRRTPEEQTQSGQKFVYSLAELSILVYILWGCFNRFVYSPFFIVQILSHIALLYLFIVKRGYISALFEHPISAKLAKYSLAVYLTHWFFVVTVRNYMKVEFPDWMEEHVAMSILIAMVGSWILGILAHHLVEKPCTRYLTNFINWMKEGVVNKVH